MKNEEKLDWFPLYWLKFSHGISSMNATEVGAYMLLLIHQWDKGFIPSDEKEIKKIAKVPVKKIQNVLKKFKKVENFPENLFNNTLEKIRIEQIEKVLMRSESGKNAARIKNERRTNAERTQNERQPLEERREDKIIIEEKREEDSAIILPFTSENFKMIWTVWKKFRKEDLLKPYLGEISEQAALKELSGFSKQNEEIAIKIIEKSISSQWSSLYELKDGKQQNSNIGNKPGINSSRLDDLIDQYVAEK